MKPASDERTPDGTEHTASGSRSEQLLTVTYTEHEHALVLRVDGEVDILTAPRLQAAIHAAFERLACATAGFIAYLAAASPRFGARWTPSDPFAGAVQAIADEIELRLRR